MDANKFIKEFQDYLAPHLDMYEQAIYIYLVRHSRLIDLQDIVVGFKSARKKLAFGIGKANTPPSERVCYEKLRSLQNKKCIKIITTEHTGTRIAVFLPHEINNFITKTTEKEKLNIENLDFFEIPENRLKILERENHSCFYCLASLNSDNYVIEHIVSRPQGNNTYRNLVASCRQCNNRKGAIPAEKYLRILYREGFLSSDEFEKRNNLLQEIKEGKIKPNINV